MSDSGTLLARLGVATRDAHVELQALPFAKALEGATLPIESYVGYLRAQATIHATLERVLQTASDGRIAMIWGAALGRFPALQQDLAHFAPQGVKDIPGAVAAALQVANAILLRSAQGPLSLLGYVYVLEGSRLGAPQLAAWAEQTFDLSAGEGLAYLGAQHGQARERWAEFGARLNDLTLSADEDAEILAGAQACFAGVHQVVAALYPFDPGANALRVNALNPEAGAHPMPQDQREVAAVQAATERCLREYPYFVWRYGERGRRYSDSDGAWLVTLAGHPQERVHDQIAWLGKVLATRGIPRLLLQRHLEILYEELLARVGGPEAVEGGGYARLLKAADRLAEQRGAVIDNAALTLIRNRFEEAAGPDWCARLPGGGALLVAAVADEHAGLTGTLAEVQGWMTDPQRFPAAWIGAVEVALREAEAVAGATID